MSRILVMPIELANKIAAGEVVDRPSSVVKELVENSIDAQAKSIEVRILDGGRTLIKVIDDGIGMDREDAVTCFKRHASSKMKSDYDLMYLKTLGFRGEAIPSIASISKVTLDTSDGKEGTLIIKEPNKDFVVSSSSLRKGTIFSVENLFHNVPARLKFLKSDRIERLNCLETVENIALGFPNIKFSVFSDDKLVFKTNGRNDMLETINSLRGTELVKKLIKFDFKINGVHCYGYISNPEINYSTRFEMHTFINNRMVYVYKLNKAIEDSYKDYLPPKRYPFVCINLILDPFLVDVNVHPSKKEVRIANEDELVREIKGHILELLEHNKPTYTINNAFDSIKINQDTVYQQNNEANKIETNNPTFTYEQTSISFEKEKANIFDVLNKNHVLSDNNITENINSKDYVKQFNVEELTSLQDKNSNNNLNMIDNQICDNNILENKENYINNSRSKNKNVSILFKQLTPLGQICSTYLIFDSEDGMVLIDQHAAAERINFEKYEELFSKPKYLIVPLIPITIEISPTLLSNLDKAHLESLTKLGIEIEEFGQNTIKVIQMPSFLSGKENELKDVITSCLKDKNVSYPDLLHLTIATIACKASIKANKKLSFIEVQTLIDQLRNCKNPANCPHGRPTIILITKHELEKLFKRTGF